MKRCRRPIFFDFSRFTAATFLVVVNSICPISAPTGDNLCLRMLNSSFHLRHPSHLGMISPIYGTWGYLSHSHFTMIRNYLCISTDLNSAHSQLSKAVSNFVRALTLAENGHRGKPDPTFSLDHIPDS